MKINILSLLLISVVSVSTAFAQQRTISENAAVSPVSYGIIVDNSGSARASLDKIVDAVKQIAESNNADDETFLVRFTSTDRIRLLEEFTKNKKTIQETADDLFTESGLTAIIDAVDFSARYLNEKSIQDAGRSKVLILITDGEERGSRAKIEETIKYLKENKIRVFSIGISDEIVVKKVLDKLANGTGGKLFLPKNQVELSAAANELAKSIRVQ